MPRKARENSQSNYHHVIVQGINKEYIFKRMEDIEKFKEIIIVKLKEANVEILAYCIMSNNNRIGEIDWCFKKFNRKLYKKLKL